MIRTSGAQRQQGITLLLAVVLGALVLGALGCPDTSPVTQCNGSNCNGCCATATQCVTALNMTRVSCGTGVEGASCRVCPTGQVCSNTAGRCVTPAPDSGSGGDAGLCGEKGMPCCDGFCGPGLVCGRGYCGSPPTDAGCGVLGGPCCAGSTCYLPNHCAGTSCAAGPPDSGLNDGGLYLKTTGEACGNGVECFDGTCLTDGYTGGVCTKACITSNDCAPGAACGKNPSGVGPPNICLKTCSQPGAAPGGCRTGYVCDRNGGLNSVPVCYPKCTTDVQCAPGRCDMVRGFCCGSNSLACCGGSLNGGVCGSATECDCKVNGTANCQANGYCTTLSCGDLGQACCTSGQACNSPTSLCQGGSCVACGQPGQPCCASSTCNSGTCVASTCVTCGQVGQYCCQGTSCNNGLACVGNGCFTCGDLGQPCCPGDSCNSGVCGHGVCTPVGAACSVANDCTGLPQKSGGQCITQFGQLYLGGYCTETCDGTTQCPLGSSCLTVSQPAGSFCFTDCVYDGGAGGCRSGYVCDNIFGTVGCVPACNANTTCETRICNRGFCCGAIGFSCCDGTKPCPISGTCGASGYCN